MLTLIDVKKIIKTIQTFYPNLLKSFSQEELFMLVKNYQRIFEGFSYEEVIDGLIEFIRTDTSGFPPPPARIIKNIYEKREKQRKINEAKEMKELCKKIEEEDKQKSEATEDWLKFEDGKFVITN